uniref:Uncharacterized protein n=1 Tax=Octopus bimaculoides TaxID=37653 RepID=A0A0L8HS46_OCTBM
MMLMMIFPLVFCLFLLTLLSPISLCQNLNPVLQANEIVFVCCRKVSCSSSWC